LASPQRKMRTRWMVGRRRIKGIIVKERLASIEE